MNCIDTGDLADRAELVVRTLRLCHPEGNEGSRSSAQGKLREESTGFN